MALPSVESCSVDAEAGCASDTRRAASIRVSSAQLDTTCASPAGRSPRRLLARRAAGPSVRCRDSSHQLRQRVRLRRRSALPRGDRGSASARDRFPAGHGGAPAQAGAAASDRPGAGSARRRDRTCTAGDAGRHALARSRPRARTISSLILPIALRRVQALRAHVDAVHDRVAAEQAVRVLQVVETLAGRLVAAVGDEAIGLQQAGRTDELVRIPPERRARGRAARAQDALVQAVELFALRGRLQALLLRRDRRR